MAKDSRAWEPPVVARQRRRGLNVKLIVGAAVILAAVGYLVFSAAQSAGVYYLTIAEAQSGHAGSGQVRVTGKVVAGSIQYDAKTMQARFAIADGPNSMPVEYKGVLPDAFVNDADVIVEGRYSQGQPFQAKDILTKCPSKYENADVTQMTKN
ncbi:MAG: cytochrome c maturation protein CcmE [Chloroflexi bacterium]|nr:cytochrome c maturation protein CcmE [Chloroflexota bacterium]